MDLRELDKQFLTDELRSELRGLYAQFRNEFPASGLENLLSKMMAQELISEDKMDNILGLGEREKTKKNDMLYEWLSRASLGKAIRFRRLLEKEEDYLHWAEKLKFLEPDYEDLR